MDWGSFSCIGEDGRQRRVWAFVMVLSWSRALYVELVRRADTASFIQCHVNAFEYFGDVPRRWLYDNAKVVTLGRDQEGRTDVRRVTRRHQRQPSGVILRRPERRDLVATIQVAQF